MADIVVRIEGEQTVSPAANQSRESIDALTQSTKQSGVAAEESNVHFENSRLLFTELNKIAPELGHVLHSAFEGPLGAVILLGMAVAEVKEKLFEYNKELDDAGDRAAVSLTNGVENLQSAWDNARTSLGKYLADADSAATDRDPTTTLIKRQNELNDLRLESAKKEIENQGKIEEASIRAWDSAHGKSKEETEADVTAAKNRTQAKIDGLGNNKSVEDLTNSLAQSLAAKPALDAAAAAAVAPAAAAAAKAEDNKTALANLREALAPGAKAHGSKAGLITEGDINADSAELNSAINPPFWKIAAGMEDPKHYQEGIGDAKSKLESDAQALANEKKENANLEAESTQLEKNKALADANLKNAEDAAMANDKRIGSGPGDIDQAKKVAQEKGFTSLINQAGGAAVADTHGFGTHDEAVHQLQESQRVGQQLAQAAKDAAAAHSGSLSIILQALNDIRTANVQLQARISAVYTGGMHQ